MSVDKVYPTEQEAQLLAALVPRNNPNPFPIEDFTAQLVGFCQRQDVRNFLFSRDPFQLSYLSNPQLAKHAVSGILTATRVENNTTRYFSDHVRSMFLMAPVFATDSLNFGFGVHEYVHNPAVFWDTLNPGHFGRSLSRFVRDDALGIMVVVMDFPEIDSVQIDFTQLLNTTGQIHSVARFRRRELYDIYERGTFDMSSLRNALDWFHASYQVRDCPVCHTAGGCGCALPPVSPRHPFDMTAFRRNMERRLGTFQGVACLQIYQDGQQVHGTAVGSRCTIVGGVNVALIERLQRWAICESSIENDPRHSLITNTNNVSGLLPNPLDPLDYDNDQAHMQADVPWPSIDEDWYGNTDDAQVHVTAEVLDDISNEDQGMEAPLLRDASEEENVTGHVVSVSGGATPAEVTETTPEGRTSSSSNSRNISSSPTSKNDSDDRELVRKLRAELRKERNRASAQRSNLRKKAENDTRKLEIKTNKEKATLLRAKEMMLRQENMRLRQQLAEQSGPADR